MAERTLVIVALLVAISCLFLYVEGSVCINETFLEDASISLAGKALVEKTKQLLDLVNEKLVSYEDKVISYEVNITSYEAQIMSYEKQIVAHRAQIMSLQEQIISYEEKLQRCGSTVNDSIENGSAYRDCKDAYNDGFMTSGVYTIQPDDSPPFQVYCDMETDGGGWTVFQRRKDGSVDFYRDWANYEQGFGSLNGEFWLGLRQIHRITASSTCATGNELRIDLGDFEGNTRYAKYGTFSIGDLTNLYRLTVSGYSGTAGDSLARHNNRPFSTKDQDHDGSGSNCAQLYTGAWWYEGCHNSNLNGLYLGGKDTEYGKGVQWRYWTGYTYSLKFTEMKARCQN